MKSKNKTPSHINRRAMFLIWNPLWRSIQSPHVSSLHMSSAKRESPPSPRCVEKTETRCDSHTGRALLMASEMVCVMVGQHRPFHITKGNIHGTVCAQVLGKFVRASQAVVRLTLSLHFPWHRVPV